jgi:exodeoxyribonuclease-5
MPFLSPEQIADLNWKTTPSAAETDRPLEPVLTDQQDRAVDMALGMCGQGFDTQVIVGPAGTGKTTVITRCVVSSYTPTALGIAAPTHKACSVLHKKLQEASATYKVAVPAPMTIHSMFNLRVQVVENGAPPKAVQWKVPDLSDYDLIIVDECSMVGKDLFDIIVDSCKSSDVPVLFTGDAFQLQPINERDVSQTFNCSRTELTEVMRHDGAILELATKIRTLKYVPVVRAVEGESSSVVTHGSTKRMVQTWLEQLREEEAQLTDAEAESEIIMLTYTNRARRAFNQRAREFLFGPDVPHYQAGDVVLALEPVIEKDRVIVQNNQTLIIAEAELVLNHEPVPDLGATFKSWKLRTRSGLTLWALDPSEEAAYKETKQAVRKKLVADAKRAKKELIKLVVGSREWGHKQMELEQIKSGWRKYYYALEEYYAELDYKYALTIHKSQGSEWQVVFVNDDYMVSRDEQAQLLYVAATRAQKVLHHVNNDPRRISK